MVLIVSSLINIFPIEDIGGSFRFEVDRAGSFAGRLYDETVPRADFRLGQACLLKVFVMNESNRCRGRHERRQSRDLG